MKTILPNYDPKVSHPFNFKISTTKDSTLQAAENLFQLLGVSTGKKDYLKKRFIATLLLNLKLSLYNEHMIAISLRPEFYAKQHNRYRPAIKTYDTVKKVIHAMADQGLIQFVRGIKLTGYETGVNTKIAPAEKILPYILDSHLKEFSFTPPAEPIVLRTRDIPKSEIDYAETLDTKEWRKDINSFNELRADSKITINNVGLGLFRENRNFFITNAHMPEKELRDLTAEDLSVIPLKTTFLKRVFCGDFTKGGRFYGGSEQRIPEELRKLIQINGEPVVELDYSSYHIRMLYNLRNKDLKGNAYESLSGGDPVWYDIYKQLALRCINCCEIKKTMKSIRYYINKAQLQKLFPDLKDTTLSVYVDKLLKKHSKIKEDFFKDNGVNLQFIDSKITNNILKHFYNKPEPVLVLPIHDSFIIAAGYKDELKEVMEQEYFKVFKKYPEIK